MTDAPAPFRTNFGPQRPGSELTEPEAPSEPPATGERLCETCGHAATCAVRVAITLVAPEGGIEIGACGVYLPIEEAES